MIFPYVTENQKIKAKSQISRLSPQSTIWDSGVAMWPDSGGSVHEIET